MNIVCAILGPIFIFAFVLAWLFFLKEALLFYRSLKIGDWKITNVRLWGLGISVAYIITALACGLLTL